MLLLPDNSQLSVPISWTNYVCDELPSNSNHFLCGEGLYKMRLLIENWELELNNSDVSEDK